MSMTTYRSGALVALAGAAAMVVPVLLVATQPASAAFPGTNGEITFVRGTTAAQPTGEVYVMQPDGSGQTRLTSNGVFDGLPAFSPDGGRIVFTSRRDTQCPVVNDEIYVMDPRDDDGDGNGDNLTRITFTGNENEFQPAFSPNGEKVAFTSNQNGNEIYIMDADGTNRVRLTNNAARDARPAFSPDGTRIAFTSNRDGDDEIYVMDATDEDGDRNGDQLTKVTDNTRVIDTHANFSPDGEKIAFTTNRDGNDEIYVTNSDGSGNPIRLTENARVDEFPAFSPDGKWLAFSSNRVSGGLDYDIYKMRVAHEAAGNAPERLTNTPEPDSKPDWGPSINRPPTAKAGGPYEVAEGDTVELGASGADPDGDGPAFRWDLDGDGEFETPGRRVSFAAGDRDGPGTQPVAVQACDASGACAVDRTEVAIANAPPRGRLANDGPVGQRQGVSVGFATANDPSAADVAAGLRYAFSCRGADLSGVAYADAGEQASATCAFAEVGDYRVTGRVLDKDGGAADDATTVTVLDTTAPELALPTDLEIEGNVAGGAVVEYAVEATDNVAVASVGCDPRSGATFPLGGTTVSCVATDAAGNRAEGGFRVRVVDTTAPSLTLPDPSTVDATGADGAVVRFAVSVTDVVDPAPTASCDRRSGSVFPIGTTTVSCTATDAAGNAASGRFTIRVGGASEQLDDLIRLVRGYNLHQGIANSLDAKLQRARDAANAADAGDRRGACGKMGAFIHEVEAQAGKKITRRQADELLARASQIRAVLGC